MFKLEIVLCQICWISDIIDTIKCKPKNEFDIFTKMSLMNMNETKDVVTKSGSSSLVF